MYRFTSIAIETRESASPIQTQRNLAEIEAPEDLWFDAGTEHKAAKLAARRRRSTAPKSKSSTSMPERYSVQEGWQ
jgi:hypothetical protein